MPPNNTEPIGHQPGDAEMRDAEEIQPTTSIVDSPELVTALATELATALARGSTTQNQDTNGSEVASNANDGQVQAEPSANIDTEMNEAEEIEPNGPNEANEDAGNEEAGGNEEGGAGGAGEAGEAGAAEADPFYGFEDEEPNFDSKDMSQVLQIWEAQHTRSGFDPVPVLKR